MRDFSTHGVWRDAGVPPPPAAPLLRVNRPPGPFPGAPLASPFGCTRSRPTFGPTSHLFFKYPAGSPAHNPSLFSFSPLPLHPIAATPSAPLCPFPLDGANRGQCPHQRHYICDPWHVDEALGEQTHRDAVVPPLQRWYECPCTRPLRAAVLESSSSHTHTTTPQMRGTASTQEEHRRNKL